MIIVHVDGVSRVSVIKLVFACSIFFSRCSHFLQIWVLSELWKEGLLKSTCDGHGQNPQFFVFLGYRFIVAEAVILANRFSCRQFRTEGF